MFTKIKSLHTLLTAVAALGFVSIATAQTVRTKPVGAVTKTIPVGFSTLGVSLINADVLVASCSSNSDSILTISGVSNVGSLLTATLPYYIEGVSGDLEGDRFEVNVAATIAAANGTIITQPTSANNTLTLSAGSAVGSSFALRRHVTLSQIQSMFSAPLVASSSAGSADQIRLYNRTSGQFTTYFLRNQTTWVTGSNISNDVAVPPGVGILFVKRTSPGSLVMTGGVRSNAFAVQMPAGFSFQAPGFPVSYSPLRLGATPAEGWTGASSQASADQIRIFNSSTGIFVPSFMRANGTWVRGSETVTTTDLVNFDNAFLLSRRVADSDYFLPRPFDLN